MKNTKTFNRRIYHNLREIITDTSAIFSKQNQIKSLMRGKIIPDAFRERIMLTVTQVNACQYCQYAHAKMALNSGLSQNEIENLSMGIFHQCPPEEVPALLYAQHWAEENGSPDEETRQNVLDIYGEKALQAIELAMRMIRMGNLMGNTWDYVLYKLSRGRWGYS